MGGELRKFFDARKGGAEKIVLLRRGGVGGGGGGSENLYTSNQYMIQVGGFSTEQFNDSAISRGLQI